jgi:uncharacterized protein YecE (DUF72 family)
LPIRIGTSGYSYPWNEGKPTPFVWYLNQGFNSVEINASFYRFPYESWIRTWQKAPDDFTFSIKVHRWITHQTRLKGEAVDLWKRFRKPFGPIEDKIDFWLFQMPPSYKCSKENLSTMKRFFRTVRLGNKAVVEFRARTWWTAIDEIEGMGVVFCSISAPKLPSEIVSTNKTVYLRLHGSEAWYSYVYSKKELDRMLSKVKRLKAEKKAIYLNNDIGMLENGLNLLKRS